jgi:hypothetical protein
MKRRSFIKTSLAAFGSSAVMAATSSGAEPSGHEVYELRVYSLPAAKRPVLDHYLSGAFMPAVKRSGGGPVGIFVEDAAKDPPKVTAPIVHPSASQLEALQADAVKNLPKVHVLIVHPSADHVATLPARLAADEEYQKAGAEYLMAPATDPVYARIESSLLLPIEGMPHLARPDTSRPRRMNLRIYESHNERAAAKKIEMFNKGELEIFRRVGLTPVFFGATVAGALMPNLTYMLVFPEDAGRTAAWSRFGKDPEWQKLKATPGYADKEIVSHITNKLLTPTPYSEI